MVLSHLYVEGRTLPYRTPPLRSPSTREADARRSGSTAPTTAIGFLVSRLSPKSGSPGRDDDGQPEGYKLACSMSCASPHHHLPEEAPGLHTPVRVAPDVAPGRRALPALQVRVAYDQN